MKYLAPASLFLVVISFLALMVAEFTIKHGYLGP